MEGVTKETTELLHKTNRLAEDIEHKAEKLNTVVDAVKGVGESVTGTDFFRSTSFQYDYYRSRTERGQDCTNRSMEQCGHRHSDKVKERKTAKEHERVDSI